MKRPAAAKLAALAFLLALAGCLPIPHMRTVAPAQEGRLLSGGKPLPGARIIQSFSYDDRSCEHRDREVLTADDGRFSLPYRRPFFLFISMGDDYHHYHICAERGGEKKWLTFSMINHETSEKPLFYDCDWDQHIQSDFPAGTRKDLPHLRCVYSN